jgi:hypothetical protein
MDCHYIAFDRWSRFDGCAGAVVSYRVTVRRRFSGVLAAVGVAAGLLAAGCGAPPLDRQTRGDVRAGLSIFKAEGCYGCHAVSGVSVGTAGPALDGEGSRRGAPWLRAMLPRHFKALRLQPLASSDLEDLVSYLESLR